MRRSPRSKTITPAEDMNGMPETLSRKQVQEALRRGSSLADADMRGLDLSDLSFDQADLRRAKLADANLSRCSFRGADLRSASLWHANLKDAVLDESVLEEADLDFANLDGVTLKAARVRKAIFPQERLSMDSVWSAVRTGHRLEMPSDEEGIA